jgi:hypothetical protein
MLPTLVGACQEAELLVSLKLILMRIQENCYVAGARV